MIDHRVMTVREPYASLLVHGLKQYETRPQATPFRGLVFLLAGQFKSDALRALAERFRWRLARRGIEAAQDLQWFTKLPRAAIIGAARLDDCRSCLDVIEDEQLSDTEEQVGFWSDENFAYRLRLPVLFKTPVPCRGLLGLTRLTQPTYAAAMQQLRDATTIAEFSSITDVMTGGHRTESSRAADLCVSE